jgi:hypothetical protein
MSGSQTRDVGEALQAAREAMDAGGFLEFPLGDSGTDTLGDLSDLPTVQWQDGNAGAFLALATSLGIRLVYFGSHRLSEEDLEPLDGIDADSIALRSRLRRQLGRVVSFDLAWVSDGVGHRFTVRHPAVEELRGLIQEDVGETGPDFDAGIMRDEAAYEELAGDRRVAEAAGSDELLKALQEISREKTGREAEGVVFTMWRVTEVLAPRIAERLAPRVASDERFRSARYSAQLDVLPNIVPEWRHFEGRVQLFRRIREAANVIVDRDLAAEAHLLRASGMTLDTIAGRIHRSANVVRRLLAEYPADERS